MASKNYIAGYTAFSRPGNFTKAVPGASKNYIAGYTAFLKSNQPIRQFIVPPTLVLPNYIPKKTVNRYNVLNNEGKTVNLFRQYASLPTTPIRWVVGHGSLTGDFPKVPRKVYIIFMAEPGHSYNKSLLTPSNRAYKNIQYLRNVFSGKEKNVAPVRLKYWKEHVYGPNDEYPNMRLVFQDYMNITNPYTGNTVRKNVHGPLNNITGVTNVENGIRTHHKLTFVLSDLVRDLGPGIYIVNACRTFPTRPGTKNTARANFNKYSSTGRYMPPISMRNSSISAMAQATEKNQARVVARKRAAANNSPRPKVRTYANVVAGRGKNVNRPKKRVRI
jgi:hypothetical protein